MGSTTSGSSLASVHAGSRVIGVLNGAAAPAKLHVPLEATGLQNGMRLQNLLDTTNEVEAREGAMDAELPPHSVAMYR